MPKNENKDLEQRQRVAGMIEGEVERLGGVEGDIRRGAAEALSSRLGATGGAMSGAGLRASAGAGVSARSQAALAMGDVHKQQIEAEDKLKRLGSTTAGGKAQEDLKDIKSGAAGLRSGKQYDYYMEQAAATSDPTLRKLLIEQAKAAAGPAWFVWQGGEDEELAKFGPVALDESSGFGE